MPPAAPAKRIRQVLLAQLGDAVLASRELDQKKKDLDATIDGLKAAILAHAKAGLPVEAGEWGYGIETESRRNIAWKDIVAKLHGPEKVEEIIQATTPTEYTRVVLTRGGHVVAKK